MYADLLEKLKAATKPSRYVDCHLWVLAKGSDARMVVCDSSTQDFVWERGIDGMWIRDVVRFRAVPKYTASIDASLALVERMLPGCMWRVQSDADTGDGCYCTLVTAPGERAGGDAETAPLAILAALLTALSPPQGDQP